MIPIASFDDPRVALYRNLKDRELAREGGRFMAEGEFILKRLLASDFPVESVLLEERRAPEFAPLVPPGVPVYVAPRSVFRHIVGHKFQSGILAVGRRKPFLTVDQLVERSGERSTLVICPEIASVENIGSLIRIAAAFGADGMLLGERCHDPFWRQSVRVSMGTLFKLPLGRSGHILSDLTRLRETWGYELIATVLDPDAEPLETATRGPRVGILFGNEAQGLDPASIAACDRRVTIRMKEGIDSLNVAVAAGIFLYHFTRAALDA
ncbi:MAG TPA: RNA methyltransferase [Tepidisphaeraceae bacterium]|jgi:tRNA G18 (ribose-2'-O)-methylase SpoU